MFQPERAGNQLRDQIGLRERGGSHAPGFVEIASHAGLAQHMLSRRQGRAGHFRVKVWPSADAHRVDFRVGDDVLPTRHHTRDAELLGNLRRRSLGPIRDGGQFDPGNLPKPRNMPSASVLARADESDTHLMHSRQSLTWLSVVRQRVFPLRARTGAAADDFTNFPARFPAPVEENCRANRGGYPVYPAFATLPDSVCHRIVRAVESCAPVTHRPAALECVWSSREGNAAIIRIPCAWAPGRDP